RLHLAFGDEAPSNRTVYNWFAEFQRGRTFLCNEFRKGRPFMSGVATNVDAVREMIERDRHMIYREIQASLGIDMKAIHTILHDHLSVRKLCSRWIPHNLIEAQKQAPVKWSKEMLKKFNRDRSTLNIVTGDETWIYSYEPESKQQSTVWVFQNEEPITVTRLQITLRYLASENSMKSSYVFRIAHNTISKIINLICSLIFL
ncbi:SETMR methyltransferase, partial [Acromyrmex heyeri]